MSSPVPNKDTVRGHGLVVGDQFDFYGMGNAGIPTEEGIRCQVGKVGNGYILTTVSGDLDTFEFGAASKIFGFKVDTGTHTVTVSEHGMGNAVAYRAECSHGWQTGYHLTAQDATDVALGHGTVSRPLYEAPTAPVYTALNPAPYAQHKGHKMNLAGTHRGNRVCLDCGTIPVGIPDETPAVRDTPQVPTLTSAQTDAMIVFVDYPDGLTESDYKYASVRKITADALVRNGMLRCDMWAGRGQVYTLDVNGLAWRDARNREGVADMSAAQRAITYPPVTDPDTLAEVNIERMMAGLAPTQGDWVYRAADSQQGRITYTLGDSVMVAWLDGGLQRLDVSALLAMGFEILPAAEVAGLKVQGKWRTPSRPVKAGTDTMLAPMRTKLNKRKRNIAKRNRRSPRGQR